MPRRRRGRSRKGAACKFSLLSFLKLCVRPISSVFLILNAEKAQVADGFGKNVDDQLSLDDVSSKPGDLEQGRAEQAKLPPSNKLLGSTDSLDDTPDFLVGMPVICLDVLIAVILVLLAISAWKCSYAIRFLMFGASFYAGQKSTGTVNFEHAEAIENVATFGEDSYFGKCVNSCDLNEYVAEGCSFFKNTVCNMCAEIKHCPHENVRCETSHYAKCSKCDDGYWGDDCLESIGQRPSNGKVVAAANSGLNNETQSSDFIATSNQRDTT